MRLRVRPTCKLDLLVDACIGGIAEFVPHRVLHADCLPTHGTLGASLAPVRSIKNAQK